MKDSQSTSVNALLNACETEIRDSISRLKKSALENNPTEVPVADIWSVIETTGHDRSLFAWAIKNAEFVQSCFGVDALYRDLIYEEIAKDEDCFKMTLSTLKIQKRNVDLKLFIRSAIKSNSESVLANLNWITNEVNCAYFFALLAEYKLLTKTHDWLLEMAATQLNCRDFITHAHHIPPLEALKLYVTYRPKPAPWIMLSFLNQEVLGVSGLEYCYNRLVTKEYSYEKLLIENPRNFRRVASRHTIGQLWDLTPLKYRLPDTEIVLFDKEAA